MDHAVRVFHHDDLRRAMAPGQDPDAYYAYPIARSRASKPEAAYPHYCRLHRTL